MSLLDPFKLEKLKVKAYCNRERTSPVMDPEGQEFEAMFNPTSFSQDYEVKYASTQGVSSPATPAEFTLSKPQQLQIDLLLDGTRVDEMGLLAMLTQTVSERIEKFLKVAYHMDGDTHEPNFLVVQWGDGLAFSCRLKKVTVAYQSFDRGGNPLRAKLTATFVSDASAETIAAEANLKSPDVTHTRVVKGGDTVPLLAKQVYGSADHYLFLAESNQLDDFRDLSPGRQLVFPPLPT